MEELFTDFALLCVVVYIVFWMLRKWRRLDLEAKQNEIKEAEAAYKTVAEIEKNYPNYRKNKEYVEKFLDKSDK